MCNLAAHLPRFATTVTVSILERLSETLPIGTGDVGYRCPSCGHVFDAADKRCPECGEIGVRERGSFELESK